MRTVMITGANSGLGYQTALDIARDKENRVILACRNQRKGDAARENIVKETGNTQVEVTLVNLAVFDSVRECAARFAEAGEKLDVLIDNAGISQRFKGTADDGFELLFETNYLGPFLLTLLLLPSMAAQGRIIVVTDDARNRRDDMEKLHWLGPEYLAYRAKDDSLRYAYSKLCDTMFAYQLARKLKAAGSSVTANAFDPGFMAATNLQVFGGIDHLHAKQIERDYPECYSTLEASAAALCELAVSPEYAKVSGAYFDRDKGVGESCELSLDKDIWLQLWESSLKFVKMDEPAMLRPTLLSRLRSLFFRE